MMSSLLSWAFRLMIRDARSGQNTILILVLCVAATTLTTVGMISNRVERLITQQAHEVLAADLRMESGRLEWPSEYETIAHAHHLETTHTISMNSMAHAKERMKLVNLLAVDPGYPLRGELKISAEPFGQADVTQALPKENEAWADPKLLMDLDLKVGDSLQIGEQKVTISAVLMARPDQSSGFADLAPTVLLTRPTLMSMHLLTEGSRLTAALLMRGSHSEIEAVTAILKKTKASAEKLITVEDSNRQLAQSLARARHFFNLTTVITLVLCIVALSLASRVYISRRWDQVALFKCLGLTRRSVWALMILQLLWMMVLSSVIGTALGWAINTAIDPWLQTALHVTLPAPNWMPVGITLLALSLMLVGFCLPAFTQLAQVPVMRLFRKDAALPTVKRVWVVGMAIVGVMGLLMLLLRERTLVWATGLGMMAAISVFYILTMLLLKGIERRAAALTGVYRLLGLRLIRQRSLIALEITALSLGLTGFLLLSVTRTDLLNQWQRSLPADTPNTFIINIEPQTHEAFSVALSELSHHSVVLAPWVRARLVMVNDHPPQELWGQARISGLAQREQNISIVSKLPANNSLVAGQFWSGAPASPEVSVAEEFAQSLNLKVGDRLQFDVAGQPVEARLSNVRQVHWDSFQPNFFLLFSPGVLEDSIGSYMTSVHLSSEARRALGSLVRQYPSVTVIDVEVILQKVRDLVERASQAIQWTFLFTLLAALLMLITVVEVSLDERRFENAMLHTLGVRAAIILRINVMELTCVGIIATTWALAVAIGISAWMSVQVFEMPWQFSAVTYGIFAGVAVLSIVLVGLVLYSLLLKRTPLELIREA